MVKRQLHTGRAMLEARRSTDIDAITAVLTEAARAVAEFGFASAPEGLGLVRIEWHAHAGDRPTVGCHKARARAN